MKNLSYQSNGSVWRLFISGSSEQELEGRYFSLYNWNAVGSVDKVQDRIWGCWTTPVKMLKYFTHINLFKMLDAAPNKFKGKKGGVGVDLASVGLNQARFVRIRQLAGATSSPEVDAVMVVKSILIGDLDDSGMIDSGDIAIMLLMFGDTNSPGDLDHSGDVDSGDVSLLLLWMGDV